MKKDQGPRTNLKKLRGRAEKSFLARVDVIDNTPIGDIRELISELHIHQVELEIQNEELRKAQLELEEDFDFIGIFFWVAFFVTFFLGFF